MVQIRRHIHLLLYFDIVKHCTVDYTNKQVDGVKESKGQKKFKCCFLNINDCYFDCSFCWLGINVPIISRIPSLINLGFVVMGYFLSLYFIFPPFLSYCCCLCRKTCFKAYYCIAKNICQIIYN